METNLTPNFSQYNPFNGLDASLQSWQAERTAAAAVSTSKSLDVQLVTAEGDKVTISMDARAAAMYGASEKTEADATSITRRKTELSVALYQREMTFTVEGDLNDQEKRDIRKALKTLDRMMNHMIHGNLKPMMAKAGKLQGLQNISSLQAQMSYERTIVVAQQTQTTAVVADPDAVAAPSIPQTQDGLSAQSGETFPQPEAVADALTQDLQPSETPMEKMMAFFNQLLDDYRKRTAAFDPQANVKIDRVADRLRDALNRMNQVRRD